MFNVRTDEFSNRLIKWRRELHQIPELEFEMVKTRAFIINELRSMGYEPELSWGKTAVIARLEGEIKQTLAFRADMDALSVTEKTEVPYESQHPGVMHACGHDGHMAALLGLAWALKNLPQLPHYSILFIFQPAEEGPGGAELLEKEGLLTRNQVVAVFGTHLFPGLQQGMVGLKSGPFMAQNGEVDLIVTGRSAHGAQPQQGIDAIVAAADLVLRLQTISARSVSPMDTVVLTFGRIEGGERCNIIAGRVQLNGTIRAFKDTVFKTVQKCIRAQAAGTEAAFDCKVDVIFRDMYPAVNNDDTLTALAASHVPSEKRAWMEPQMLAEDFAYYQKAVPGLFYFMGTGNDKEGLTAPLHNACFNFNESVLCDIVELNLHIIEGFTGQSGEDA